MEEIITFEYIREIQRAEIKSQQLCNLPEDFFDNVKNYLEQKKELAKKNEDASVEFRNAERIIEDIYNRRESKVVSLALLSVRTGIIPANMTKNERELFDYVVRGLKNSRGFLDKLLWKKDKKSKDDVEYVEIAFLEDVEEFVGIDLKKLGPYNKGDKALIPKNNAELLIKSGKAIKVNE